MTAALQQHFDRMYSRNPDPWGYEYRWYEKRKRALLLAALPKARYALAFEPACGNGALTIELAARCDVLFASDGSERAIQLAKERLRGLDGVQVRQQKLPGGWLADEFDGRCDLIVLSEIGYYLSEAEMDQLVDRIPQTLAPMGTLVACHWRRHADDSLRHSEAVHRQCGSAAGLTLVVHHEEKDFLLDVWSNDARSVADMEASG
ncbi:MAG: Methyltransferase type 12 [Bradyrhizobium sp.]|nr:Methyltransferase type 12 [Bradyrhizobium sp.]